jgi:acyl CoA:acetate/3-ketoacid CoA transferase
VIIYEPSYSLIDILAQDKYIVPNTYTQFDFYDGGGLDMCFLGAAQISPEGDVNVSRLCKDKLIGPGGFIDISQSTRNISFLSTFTAIGLKVDIDSKHGSIRIENEGTTRKFVNEVYERTFSGDEAVRRGQKVYYVTERAVFRRTAAHSTIELIEIAPGVDMQKDILDQMVSHLTPVCCSTLYL